MDKKVFYTCSNNGVSAVMTEAAYQELEHREHIAQEARDLGKEIFMPPVRQIFTFSDSPNLKHFITGSSDLMVRLLVDAEVRRGNIWVPFSNGTQWDPDQERRDYEIAFRTTLDQAFQAFGLMLESEIPAKAS